VAALDALPVLPRTPTDPDLWAAARGEETPTDPALWAGAASASPAQPEPPLPLPLSPVNSPEDEAEDEAAAAEASESESEDDLAQLRATKGAHRRAVLLSPDDSPARAPLSELAAGPAETEPAASPGPEARFLYPLPFKLTDSGLAPPQVIDLSAVSPAHAASPLRAAALAWDDEEEALPRGAAGRRRKNVLLDSSSESEAEAEAEAEADAAASGGSASWACSAGSESDSSPLRRAKPRGAAAPALPAPSPEEDPFGLGPPSPGGGIAGLPLPPPSPAWVPSCAPPTPSTRLPPSARKPPRTPAPAAAPPLSGPAFQRAKTALAASCFAELNALVFGGRLPPIAIEWSARMKTTAGVTYTSRAAGADGQLVYVARVALSSKVIDDGERLRQTLCHEMCHAAAWLLEGSNKPPHGEAFRRWAARASAACPSLDVRTCHSYSIAFAFRYACTTDWCLQEYGRHSASIDTARKACGVCGGRLALLPKLKADGTPAAKREPAAFSLFVKERFKAVKAAMPKGSKHAAVMAELSRLWREEKGEAAKENEAEGVEGALRALAF